MRSALALCRSIRTPSVFTPRSTSQQSNGPGTAPIAFWWNRNCPASSPSASTSAPPTTSQWPPRTLVVECTTTFRAAPEVRGVRVHAHVRAERQRLLQVRRGEGVVDDEQRSAVVRELAERG